MESTEKHYYQVDVTWTSGRRGIMCSPDLTNTAAEGGCIEIATPPQFAMGVEGIWSPEHLYTASVNSCFLTTFLAIAENSRLAFNAFRCRGIGVLEKIDGKFMMTEIRLAPVLTIPNEADREKAIRVLDKAERACLISNSIKSKVTLTPEIHMGAMSRQLVQPN